MVIETFRKEAKELIDWICDYYEHINDLPVRPGLKPGEIITSLPESPPLSGTGFDLIMNDFDKLILPGITHWQSPKFHAYFPGNSSLPSILGEVLTSAIAAQCMMWQTSPAAAELEELMMEWLKQMCGLPEEWHGVIQDTASTATLCSLITAREKFTDYKIKQSGFAGRNFRVYCSAEAHSSIDKAVQISGIGSDNLVKIPVDENFAMKSGLLRQAIANDLQSGKTPLCVIGALGTTGSLAVDPLLEIGEICNEFGLWYHIDAAMAGTAMVLPEMRHFLEGVEYADTYVFNPHKWMFTNFDCSAYFVRDKEALIRTFEIVPEYLKTGITSKVNNYKDWGIQLGRRFRALKLWIVIRSFGVEGIKEKIANHISWTKEIADIIDSNPNYHVVAPVDFNLICVRFINNTLSPEDEDRLNEVVLNKLNESGKIFLSHTKLSGRYTIRIVYGQTYLTKEIAIQSWETIDRFFRKESGELYIK